MAAPVRISEIIDAVESAGDMTRAYLDRQSGRVVAGENYRGVGLSAPRREAVACIG